MLARLKTFTLSGIEALPVGVEVMDMYCSRSDSVYLRVFVDTSSLGDDVLVSSALAGGAAACAHASSAHASCGCAAGATVELLEARLERLEAPGTEGVRHLGNKAEDRLHRLPQHRIRFQLEMLRAHHQRHAWHIVDHDLPADAADGGSGSLG